MIVLTLVQNVALLVSLSVVLLFITRRLGHTLLSNTVSGVLFGLVAVAGMMTPLRLSPGVIFDGRSVIIAVAGFSGGPVTALISGIIAAAYRLSLGGGGAWVGVAVILEAGLLGVAMYYLHHRYPLAARIPALVGFGLLVHILMLCLQLLLPGGVGPGLVARIGPSVIVFFSLATALVCRLLLDQEERETAAEEIRKSEVRYRLLAENTGDGIWEVDLDSFGVYANPAIERLIGYTPEEYVGMPVSVYCTPEFVATIEQAAREALERLPDRTPRYLEAVYRHRDGHPVHVEIVYAVKVDADGTPVGFQGVTRDVSERKAAERLVQERNEELERLVSERTAGLTEANEALMAATAELSRMNEKLQDANETKTRFLRSMSHELRTPLNSIIGFSEILGSGLAGDLSEEQSRQVAMINASGRHLLAIVNDVLDLARIEAHRITLEVEEFDVAAVAAQALATVSDAAQAKGLEVRQDIPGEPLLITSDPRKIAQILLNLLGNAVKFTDEGSVGIAVRSLAGDRVGIVVSDTGPGIAPEAQEEIFSEFVQHDRSGEGTGLGLAISRSLASTLGGTLTVASSPGQGASFTITLPRAIEPQNQEQ